MNIIDVKHCGEIIVNEMEGTSPLTYSFKRIMQVVKMPTSSDILNKKDAKVSLDPELLLQKLVTVCSDDDRNDALKYIPFRNRFSNISDTLQKVTSAE